MSTSAVQFAPWPYVPPVITSGAQMRVQLPREFNALFQPKRYKVYYGGRGSCKSWSVARALLMLAHTGKKVTCEKCMGGLTPAGKCETCRGTGTVTLGYRIGCFRELQNSIKDSVHKLLVDQIDLLGLTNWFHVTRESVYSYATKSEFLFKGLRGNANEIKSTEGIDIAWVEEAQLVSYASWEILIPTIRKPGSEIWVTFNPEEEEDNTYQRFIGKDPNVRTMPEDLATIIKINWDRNPWMPATLDAERRYLQERDPEAYQHVWEGMCRVISDAVIFRGKYTVHAFETPTDPPPDRFFHGLDFGFANDPLAMTRSYITGVPPNEELWIDYEIFAFKVEIDDTPALLRREIPSSAQWPIKADCARPESISYLKRQGFNIKSAEKWAGCVEDRITHLRTFKMIHIHERCKHMREEARLYRYKVDRISGDVLPVIVDANNHGWDATGYGLDGYIQRRGVSQVWAKL